jgi:hypothetical protein
MEARVSAGKRRVWPALSVASACAIFICVNALGARHYVRWDATTSHRFSLGRATDETLSGLSGTVRVSLVLADRDPAKANLLQLLEAYRAKSAHIDVKVIDPDRDAQLMRELYRRTNVNLATAEEDIALVVEREGRHWFVTMQDLFGADERDPSRLFPREERAVTSAIRAVVVGDKTRLCFTAGHEELAISADPRGSIGSLSRLLERDNHELSTIDLVAADAQAKMKVCDVVVVAGPRTSFAAVEAERLRTYAMLGGSVLIAAGPIFARDASRVVPLGLATVAEPFGILLDDQLVVERDPMRVMPETAGTGFFVSARPHAVTHGLLGESPKIGIVNARPMRHHAALGAAVPSALLLSSEAATARSDDEGADEWKGTPPARPSDRKGPFVLAMASERDKISGSDAHGPRLVVIGSGYAFAAQTFELPPAVRGLAYLTEGAIAWLAKRPVLVDVPEREASRAPLVLTEAGRSRVRQYVLLWMPLAAALLGLLVFLRRRSTERRT